MKTTIIIPSYKNDPYIEEAKKNIAEKASEAELLVMQEGNFAQNCNIGATKAQGEYLLFFNNDAEIISDNFIQTLIDSLQEEDEWLATPMIIFKQTRVHHVIWMNEVRHVYSLKDRVQCAGIEFNQQGLPYEFGRTLPQTDVNVKGKRRCLGASGCCFLIKKNKFLELGGFDESFVNGWEDNDFTLRMLEAGGVAVYNPEAKIKHLFAGSEGRFDKEEENLNKFIVKWNGKNVGIIQEARKRL